MTDISDLESAVGGKMGIHRLYYGSGQIDGAVRQAKEDLANGRIPWISFKAPKSWSAMASGSGDSWAREAATKLGSLDGPVWVAVHHEPENEGPAADWRRMQQRIAPIFRAQPNIAFTIILMGWKQFFSNDASSSMDAYWPGKQHVDVVAFDPYNWYGTTSKSGGKTKYTWDELREYYVEINKWRRDSGNLDVPWAIAETGYNDVAASVKQNTVSPAGNIVSTRGSGADWLTRAFDDMQAMGGIAMAYFHVPPSFTNEPSNWSWPIWSSVKIRKFQDILARSSRFTDSSEVTVTPPTAPTGPVAFQASSTFSGNVTRASIRVPSTVRAGDAMIMFVSTNTGVAPLQMPNGWTRIGTRQGEDMWSGVWTRTASSTDAGRSYQVDLSGYTKIDATILAYSGTATDPVAAVASRSIDAKNTRLASPALNLVEAQSLVVSYWVNRSSSISNWSLPGGQFVRSQNAGSGGGRLSSIASDPGGTSSAGQWSPVVATTTNSSAITWSVALRPG